MSSLGADKMPLLVIPAWAGIQAACLGQPSLSRTFLGSSFHRNGVGWLSRWRSSSNPFVLSPSEDSGQVPVGLDGVGLEVACPQAGHRVILLGVEGFKELDFVVDLVGEFGQELA